MTIKELKALLNTYDENIRIVFNDTENGYTDFNNFVEVYSWDDEVILCVEE